MTILFTVLLVLHGGIHLLGPAKAFQWGEVSQLTQPISRTAGVFWLAASAPILVAAALLLSHHQAWWAFAGGAVVCSQVLIIRSWADARFGTLTER
jgi:hypothetical protein